MSERAEMLGVEENSSGHNLVRFVVQFSLAPHRKRKAQQRRVGIVATRVHDPSIEHRAEERHKWQ